MGPNPMAKETIKVKSEAKDNPLKLAEEKSAKPHVNKANIMPNPPALSRIRRPHLIKGKVYKYEGCVGWRGGELRPFYTDSIWWL